MKKHTNFTLVEIIVVVGIIAVLAGLVFPAIRNAQISAKRTQCISNQGQTMKTITMMMNANDQKLFSGNSFETAATIAWDRYLFQKNKVLDLTAYRCPSIVITAKAALDLEDNASNQNELNNRLKRAYGVVYSTSGSFDFRGTKLLTYGTIQIAPNKLALGGCTALPPSDGKSEEAYAVWDPSTNSSTTIGRLADVHGGYTNVFYLDGHANSCDKTMVQESYYPKQDESGADKINVGNMFNPDDL